MPLIDIGDGIFLHREELIDYWDYSVSLDVRFEVAYSRMAQRDGNSSADPEAEENRRYLEGQRIYLSICDPKSAADVMVRSINFVARQLGVRSTPEVFGIRVVFVV